MALRFPPHGHGALSLAVGRLALHGFAFVNGMLAQAEAELDLDFSAPVKIQRQGNQRTAFERDLANQPLDFMLMQEQAPRSARSR